MVLVGDGLRVGTVTGHIPLKDVPDAITTAGIMEKAPPLRPEPAARLRRGEAADRRAGLNPTPATGAPWAARTASASSRPCGSSTTRTSWPSDPTRPMASSGSGAYKQFDGVLAMPTTGGAGAVQALSFGQGVNYTAGLPVVAPVPTTAPAWPSPERARPTKARSGRRLAGLRRAPGPRAVEGNDGQPLKEAKKPARTKG